MACALCTVPAPWCRYDPTCGAAWYQLGLVSRALGHRDAAEAQLLTAVRLAATQPALPYSSLPLRLPVVV